MSYVLLSLQKIYGPYFSAMALPQVAQPAKRTIVNSYSVHLLNIPGVNAFCAKYTKKYAYASTVSKLLDFPEAALHPKFEKRWQTRQEPLWWNVTARRDFEHKRSVRSWVSRRVRVAFVESLRKRGYAQDGSRINGAGEPLVGTAQFFPERPILNTKFKDLVLQTDSVVTAIINRGGGLYKGVERVQGEKKRLFPKYTKKKDIKPPEIERPAFRKIKF
jgi:hypothetical protein